MVIGLPTISTGKLGSGTIRVFNSYLKNVRRIINKNKQKYILALFSLLFCHDKTGAMLINKNPGIIIGITVELK